MLFFPLHQQKPAITGPAVTAYPAQIGDVAAMNAIEHLGVQALFKLADSQRAEKAPAAIIQLGVMSVRMNRDDLSCLDMAFLPVPLDWQRAPQAG